MIKRETLTNQIKWQPIAKYSANMVQSYPNTWDQDPGVQAKPRAQIHHCFRHLAHQAKFPLVSTLHCASTLERQRSRFYKALTREKRNFKIKTFTAKIRILQISGRFSTFGGQVCFISVAARCYKIFPLAAMFKMTQLGVKKRFLYTLLPEADLRPIKLWLNLPFDLWLVHCVVWGDYTWLMWPHAELWYKARKMACRPIRAYESKNDSGNIGFSREVKRRIHLSGIFC